MHHPAGVSTGAMNGNGIEADGTSGNVLLLLNPPRCQSTSVSIQETMREIRGMLRNYCQEIVLPSKK